MPRPRIFDRIFGKEPRKLSYLRSVATGSLYRTSDLKSESAISTIQQQILVMRALAEDSQIATALSYYATDATIANSDGNIIWAVPVDDESEDVADTVNQLFKQWDVNSYARDHILELATIGNLYIPTSDLYRDFADPRAELNVSLDNNTIPQYDFKIIPAYNIPPEDIVHIYQKGEPIGYIMEPDDDFTQKVIYPETSIIHFALGGLLGEYSIDVKTMSGDEETYDIKFAQPLMKKAVQPTQTLSLLEDALLLSSLTRVVRFISVECNDVEESEIAQTLFDMKDAIEQQMSLNTASGDAQSFINPQSPNNLIYLPMINGQVPVQITDLNMAEANDAESNLLDHYQDKKLSVLGVPKEAMNFSSNEGLGGAGSVLSQRSALYANALQRLENAYMAGWKDAIDKYFTVRNMSGFIDRYQLKMQPIVTPLSTVISEKRDAAVGQAQQLVELLRSVGIDSDDPYKEALVEVLAEEFPTIASAIMSWNMHLEEETNEF